MVCPNLQVISATEVDRCRMMRWSQASLERSSSDHSKICHLSHTLLELISKLKSKCRQKGILIGLLLRSAILLDAETKHVLQGRF